MHKHLKSVVSAILAVLMMISLFCTSAMAAELTPSRNKDDGVLFQSTDASARLVLPNIYQASSVNLTTNRTLATVPVTQDSRTVQYKVVGNSGSTQGQGVVFQFKNVQTGTKWIFTAVADQGWHSTTYKNAFPQGNYELSVTYVGHDGYYGVEIHFLP